MLTKLLTMLADFLAAVGHSGDLNQKWCGICSDKTKIGTHLPKT